MATFKRFEDIKAESAKTHQQSLRSHRSEKFARDFGLRNQIQRASVSVMANIAEGFGRHSDKDFANFLSMAHASVSEVQSHLYVALDLEYIETESFDELYGLLNEIAGMTFRLAEHLRTNTRRSP